MQTKSLTGGGCMRSTLHGLSRYTHPFVIEGFTQHLTTLAEDPSLDPSSHIK